MTREDIVRMAQEAGLVNWEATAYANELGRFAKLIAEQEREQCKKLCTWKTGNQFVDEAVAVCYRAIDQRGQA